MSHDMLILVRTNLSTAVGVDVASTATVGHFLTATEKVHRKVRPDLQRLKAKTAYKFLDGDATQDPSAGFALSDDCLIQTAFENNECVLVILESKDAATPAAVGTQLPALAIEEGAAADNAAETELSDLSGKRQGRPPKAAEPKEPDVPEPNEVSSPAIASKGKEPASSGKKTKPKAPKAKAKPKPKNAPAVTVEDEDMATATKPKQTPPTAKQSKAKGESSASAIKGTRAKARPKTGAQSDDVKKVTGKGKGKSAPKPKAVIVPEDSDEEESDSDDEELPSPQPLLLTGKRRNLGLASALADYRDDKDWDSGKKRKGDISD